MEALDYAILVTYLVGALGVGVYVTRRASSSADEYFVGGRSFPWWLAGTSMVATTFAADTPLAITGLVASGGIAGNWVWWSWAIAHVVAAVVFAKYWRRLEVMTDAEVLERRYSGKVAAVLRVVKAGYEAIFINCLTMGWVILAMRKIATVLFPEYDPLLVTFSLVALAVVYSLLGGIRSVVLTDLVQFTLAMVGAVLLAVFVVGDLGGIDGLMMTLEATYPDRASSMTSFLPEGDLPGLPLTLFAVLLTVAWWRQAQGSGYIVQRLSSTRSVEDAERAGVWFAVLHNAIRPWPWILVALAALVIWPLEAGTCIEAATCPGDYTCVDGTCVVEDREATYAMLMARALPPGLLGLMVVGMLAAFMSTIDTHVNWGSSYVVGDVWRRFVDPDAGPRRLVLVGRVSVVTMATLAVAASFMMTSIAAVWLFLIALGSGIGSVAIARWLWWRVNAAAELTAVIAATLLAFGSIVVGADTIFGADNPLFVTEVSSSARILVVSLGSLACWVPVAWLGGRTDASVLRDFYERVRPVPLGWREVDPDPESDGRGMATLLRLLAGFAAVFLTLFGIGGVLLHDQTWSWALALVAGLVSFVWLLARD